MVDRPEAFPSDADIDDVLAEFGGDHCAAIGALLNDLAVLAGDYESTVSRGFVRGFAFELRLQGVPAMRENERQMNERLISHSAHLAHPDLVFNVDHRGSA